MAQIRINEISQNYTYNIGASSFATVALPITASWGPAFEEPESLGVSLADELEATTWLRFPATQAGLESFVSTFRGPSSNYRAAKDYSYQMAMTLMTSGYDVLVCRLCPGTKAGATVYLYTPAIDTEGTSVNSTNALTINAKYPGTFGNNLMFTLSKVPNRTYWNLVTSVVDASGVQTAVENLTFVFDINNATDTIPHITEVESNFFTFNGMSNNSDFDCGLSATPSTVGPTHSSITLALTGGTDIGDAAATIPDAIADATALAVARYTAAGYTSPITTCEYVSTLAGITTTDTNRANTLVYNEWLYRYAYEVYSLLQDKLNYNPNRIISPGWDDQDICALEDDVPQRITQISPLHLKLMETAYFSRCATALLDVPRSASRATVYEDSATTPGYAQLLARYQPTGTGVNTVLYTSHSALVAPWGQYQYIGTNKQAVASPAFLALMIQRAMILNQSLQYEWALPTNRKHSLRLGKLDYKVPKNLLDVWQNIEGVGINVITDIPDIGTGLWGNSTLFEVPPATYQALANLSTRYLVNAVEDVSYKCGMAITYQYNNEQAYNKFYAGVTPTLDTMKNVGAIDDYYVRMAADINGLGQVNANTVIGKIYLVINGVINDIYIDLIALPPGSDLSQYKS